MCALVDHAANSRPDDDRPLLYQSTIAPLKKTDESKRVDEHEGRFVSAEGLAIGNRAQAEKRLRLQTKWRGVAWRPLAGKE
jgi:hypothetical protein